MKKIVLFTLVALGLTLNQAMAQNISLAHDTTYGVAVTTVDVHNTVYNSASNDVAITWKMVTQSLAPGWTISGVCDNNLCYNWTGDVENGVTKNTTVLADSNMDVKIQYDASAAANGTTSVVAIRYSEPFNSKTATFIATKVATGVVSVTKSDDNVVLYPNPAKDDLNVVFSSDLGVKNIAVYNLIGKIVNIYKVAGNSAKLNLNNAPSGIYFVRLLDAQGRIIATRKFTHQ